MSLNPEGLHLYHDCLVAMINTLRDLPQPLVKGRACALGTLTSMQRRIEKLIRDWETRAMTEVDRKDVSRDGAILHMLRDDKWVYGDFDGIAFNLPQAGDGLTFVEAMTTLEAVQSSAVSS
ncbi:hypothetical protein [Asticcacaulis excentricus]|uniref:Uncharacterized protein n=1 Tax=Asticcacaulis excentricus (strain ATCC 15261 / DSM 4724 / KCTC 12464 / NCIMB 9791 / VKM B-1370 / CB 48) TaxID=573065 RepID=E8RM46_ASTEC|nr:hypothetical protein [Asticcacaulis excentricus]ADU12738.1 hypothetical protein Astex_1059 [Asticcacaulis excentricus CB 48]